MTEEQLKTAIELNKDIEYLKNQLDRWKNAESFKEKTITLWCPKIGGQMSIDNSYIDFEIIKALTISTITKKLEELENQFKDL